jgi:hypothetical protein
VLGSGGRSFFAYLTDPGTTASGGANANLVVIDVTDRTTPVMVTIPPTVRVLPPGNKLGVMGNQASLNVVIVDSTCPQSDAGIAECGVGVAHFLVNAQGVSFDAVKPVGKTAASGNVGFIDDTFRNINIIGFPPTNPPPSPVTCVQNSRTSGYVQAFVPTTLSAQGSPISIAFEMTQFAGNGAAFDAACNTVYFTSAINDIAIFAVHLGNSPAVLKQCETEAGTNLLFEPYTRSLFRGVGTDMRVFSVNRALGAPTLTDKPLTQLKANFAFGPTAVRSPRVPLATCN